MRSSSQHAVYEKAIVSNKQMGKKIAKLGHDVFVFSALVKVAVHSD